MKKYLHIIFAAALVCGVQSVSAAGGRVTEILQALALHVYDLGNYEVTFTVEAGGRTTDGSYTVSGDNYYMKMGSAEIYCDGKARYEVNNRTKEVTIDVVDANSRNILNNPTRAFDLMGDEFTADLLWERAGQALVRLTPKSPQASMSTMTLSVDTQQMCPRVLTYDFDGDQVTVTVLRMEAGGSAPKAFKKSAYAGYEMIDFR